MRGREQAQAWHRLQKGIRVVGETLERGGEGSVAILKGLARNPTLAIALATVVLFAVARIPTEVFYSAFGIRPEDVGLNSVQILLQGSAILLVVMLFLSLGVVAVTFLGFWISSAVLASGPGSLARVLKSAFRLSLLPILVLTIAFALWVLITLATRLSDEVLEGKGTSSALYPWRAEHVRATWRDPARRRLPGCRQLFYLGEAHSRVVLYDASRNATYRINSETIEIEIPLDCP